MITPYYLYSLSFPNGKQYIGFTKNIRKRMNEHKAICNTCKRIAYLAIQEFGWDSIVVKVLCIGSKEYMKELEIRAIAKFNTFSPNGYNMTRGGFGTLGVAMSKEHRLKISKSLKGRKRGATTDDVKAKISNSLIGHQITNETRAKISNAHIGKVRTLEHKLNIGNSQRGVKKSMLAITKRVLSYQTNFALKNGIPISIYKTENNMRVTLINHTQGAVDTLLFTKSTRLELSPTLLDDINKMPPSKKLEELEYIANTIPSSHEFVDYTFLIQGVSRAFTHQFVRTRNATYAQQTMRVLDMGNFEYIYTDKNIEDAAAFEVIKAHNEATRIAYNKLIALGQAPEDARGILPTNISTNIVAKFNLRAFCDLARSRTGGRTQKEYQKVINAMVDAVLKVHPWAEKFIFKQDRNYFAEIEAFAEKEYGGDLLKKGQLLKIVDAMRKS